MISLIRKRADRNQKAVVLMYHRISDIAQDPWDLCVDPENFADHLRKLKVNFDVIPMYRLAERLRNKDSLKNLVAITFDDGYYDNYQNAKPILEKHGIPATFYLTTKFKADKKYWWDELEQIILNTPVLPETASINLPGKQITSLLGDSKELDGVVKKQNSFWRYGRPLNNSRLKLYFECWEVIKTLGIEEQHVALRDIKAWAGVTHVPTPPLMNEQQVKEVSKSSLFEIGAHTINHPALGSLSSATQREEIVGSKKALENVVSQHLTGFAYPYGHYNEQTPGLTKSSGFSYAVTTEEKPLTPDRSVFEIPRFQVKNITGSQLIDAIHQWKKQTQ
jgi:peptidoglycan/xylan/chitin deacetylase (PgdA/CDA1 family)